MKKRQLIFAFLLGFALVAVSPSAAASRTQRPPAVSGEMRMTLHTHSNVDPNWTGLLFPTDRLSFNFSQGEDFSYSSRTCSGRAPFNDVGLDFWPNYPGVDDDSDGRAAVRHRMQGTATRVAGSEGSFSGRTTTVLCTIRDGAQVETSHAIVANYRAHYVRVSSNQVRIHGNFRISPTESTGTFQGLRGEGSIEGVLTCLSQPDCQARGHFTDFVGAGGDLSKGPGELFPGVVSHYEDRSVLTG